VLAGDFNTLDNDDITPVFHRPTRGANKLDRIYVNQDIYVHVRPVASAVRSDHKTVIAYNGPSRHALNKEKRQVTFGQRTPTQHAMFLQYLRERERESIYLPKHKYNVIIQLHTVGGLPKKQSLINAGRP